jgi:hypothetical protein
VTFLNRITTKGILIDYISVVWQIKLKIPFMVILMAYISRSCDFPKTKMGIAYVSRSCDLLKRKF